MAQLILKTLGQKVHPNAAVAPSSNVGAEAVLPQTVDLRRSTRTRKQTEFFQSGQDVGFCVGTIGDVAVVLLIDTDYHFCLYFSDL